MEECDVQLLLLGKLCKGSLDLPKWVTSRVDRDFRIEVGKIAKCQDGVRTAREKRKRGGSGGKGKGGTKKKKQGPASSSRRKSSSGEASVFSIFAAIRSTWERFSVALFTYECMHVCVHLSCSRFCVVLFDNRFFLFCVY